MAKNIYVGNLSYDTDESTIETLFTEYGAVDSIRLIVDRDTGRSKGFAFVEMGTDEEGNSAIETLNEKEVDGRRLIVNEARERQGGGGGRKPGGNGGGRNFRGGGGGGRFNRDDRRY
ncbi:MAG: RNA-binding protein [Candidatus Eremiobacterota bacterium]